MKVCVRVVMSFFVLSGLLSTFARADESEGYIRMLQSNNVFVRIEAAKLVEGNYLLNPAVYEAIEKRLLKSVAEGDFVLRERLDEIGWLCKALAASGNLDYAATLKEVARTTDSKKVRLYARQSLATMPEFALRHRLLEETPGDDSLDFDANRLYRMLRSGDPALQRNAAKRITRSVAVPQPVYTAAAAALDNLLEREQPDMLESDTIGWLCKALATSGDRQFLGILNKVEALAGADKLRQHAREAARLLSEQ